MLRWPVSKVGMHANDSPLKSQRGVSHIESSTKESSRSRYTFNAHQSELRESAHPESSPEP